MRNHLMGLGSTDLDFAVKLNPERVMGLLTKAHIKVLPTGIDHGTVTAILNGKSYEITTCRSDEETDGRHAKVSFSTSWRQDAKRRDFTINALYMDLEGDITDPTALGVSDIQDKRLRFVGDPALRVREDYLRILRYYRFLAQLDLDADETTRVSMTENAKGLQQLSSERITSEILKILSHDSAAEIIGYMLKDDILSHSLGGNYACDETYVSTLYELIKKQKRYDLYCNNARLYVLIKNRLDEINLTLSKKTVLFLNQLLKLSSFSIGSVSDLKQALYLYGRDVTSQALLLAEKHDEALIKKSCEVDVPVFPVSGKKLKALGFQEGPELGAALKKLEKKWLGSGCTLEEPALLDSLK